MFGIVFQSYNLFPHMTVMEERDARPDPGGRDLQDRGPDPGEALLESVGMSD